MSRRKCYFGQTNNIYTGKTLIKAQKFQKHLQLQSYQSLTEFDEKYRFWTFDEFWSLESFCFDISIWQLYPEPNYTLWLRLNYYRLIPKICEWAKYQNRYSSKSIWVMKLFFCQTDRPIRGEIWQKDSFITHILFELCLFWYLAHSQILGISL